MYLLLSGEGSGDIGICKPSAMSCDGEVFQEGPMAIIVDQLVELFQGYEMSHLGSQQVGFVSESYLAENKQPPVRKSMSLKGKKRPAETKYFFENARALAVAANIISRTRKINVVAVLFRDSDGTASAGRGLWKDKRSSIIEGFKAESFDFGVAMIPKPKSESWLICATKPDQYQHCAKLEDESGNDKGANPLKDQLSELLDGNSGTQDLNQLLRDKTIDVNQIDMPSFSHFRADLERAVMLAAGTPI